jgi:protease-4
MTKKEGVNRFVRFIQAFGMTFGALMSFLFFIIVLIIVIALFIPAEGLVGGNVAVVPIKGTITTGGDGDWLEERGTPSETIIGWITEADEDPGTRAILLEIDSPGGSPVATDEIARAVKEANKTVVAVIRESGTSGAFWVASAADYIFANRMSLTGSIGVVGSRLEFAGLLSDYNITYRRLVAGKYKDAGSRWKEMTLEEQELFQKMLNEVHVEFVEAVAANRKLSIEQVKELAHGFVFTGAEAKAHGLIDELGNKDDAVKHIEQQLNITAELYEFEPTKTFFEEIIGISSYHIGRGIGTALTTRAATDTVTITT